MLIGLVLLLGVQLTGFSCLSDFDLDLSQGILLSQSHTDDSVSSLGISTEDGCPCHLLFHTASQLVSSVVSPFIAKFSERPDLAVSAFSRVLFRPPSLT